MRHHPRHKARLLLIPVFVAAVAATLTFAVHGLWNGVLTEVVAVKPVTYAQALGLLVLAKILFGGFPGRGGRHCGPPWRRHGMDDHCASLTPEQREEMRKRFGGWPRPCWGRDDGDEPPAAPKNQER